MKPELQAKYLQFLSSKKNKEEGFTLIELLVVVIIIGVLAAVALPNLLGQVAKGRQAEAKNNLGAINRANQATRLEKATFATISDLETKVSWQYYSAQDGVASANTASYGAAPLSEYSSDVKAYAASVETDGTEFSSAICESSVPPGAVDLGDAVAANGACTDATQQIK